MAIEYYQKHFLYKWDYRMIFHLNFIYMVNFIKLDFLVLDHSCVLKDLNLLVMWGL